ncbi:MAG TPA: hypothetical protein VN633_21565 [Bryobacteraceae bacterium]|nr:hypothetical protein [Bryobacteraceae bacterium]
MSFGHFRNWIDLSGAAPRAASGVSRRFNVVLLLLTLSAHAEVLDKIAIIVDHTVITEMQLDEELRVTAFLNHEPVKHDVAARQAAARRLIEQELVRQEASATQYTPPSPARVDRLYADTEKEYGGAKPMTEALDKYGLNEAILKDHLRRQLMILGFIDLRFRPDVEISEQDITEYYNKKLADWTKAHQGTGTPPTLDDSRAAIERSLTNERSEYALSLWLDEARKEVNIVYLDKDLAKP